MTEAGMCSNQNHMAESERSLSEEGGKEGRREGGMEGRREGGKEGRREGGWVAE